MCFLLFIKMYSKTVYYKSNLLETKNTLRYCQVNFHCFEKIFKLGMNADKIHVAFSFLDQYRNNILGNSKLL